MQILKLLEASQPIVHAFSYQNLKTSVSLKEFQFNKKMVNICTSIECIHIKAQI